MPNSYERIGYSLLTHRPFCLNTEKLFLKLRTSELSGSKPEQEAMAPYQTFAGWIGLAVGVLGATAWAWLRF